MRMKRKDIALVIGHDRLSKGAYSPYLKVSEYDYYKELSKYFDRDVYTHSPNVSYKRKMKATYNKLSHYDVTLELHFNAAGKSVQGVEAFYFHTNLEGRDIAKFYCQLVSNKYGIRNRRAKPLSNDNQRGYWAVASGVPTGLLLEPFFGSNSKAKMFECKERHADLMQEFMDRI